jgi:LmbE family N-acetylglucosaminyl deacetylase
MAPVNPKRLIGAGGPPDSDWLSSHSLRDLPAIGVGELLALDSRLVIVAPHPDDEVLACGGLLAMHADRGGRSDVIGVTDGEASHSADLSRSPELLAISRRAESSRGLQALRAAPHVTRLGIPDGQVRQHADRLVGALLLLLEPSDTVVVTWRFDGHPDHEAAGEAAVRACARVGSRLLEAPVWMWDWASPGDARVPWHGMRRLALPMPIQMRKRQALAMHQTQLQDRAGDEGPVLGSHIVSRASRDFEVFF